MTYDADVATIELERLRTERRRRAERMSSSREVLPAIKMLIDARNHGPRLAARLSIGRMTGRASPARVLNSSS